MKFFCRVLFVGLVTLMLAACTNEKEQLTTNEMDTDETDRLMIYTTLYPLEFLANEIGGDKVHAESILPAGSDSHTFEPTSRMMVEIAEADLFIFNDEVSESYATSIKDAVKDEAVEFLEASEGLDKLSYHHDHDHEGMHHDHDDEDDHHHDHSYGDFDPHVWISPNLMVNLAENILTKLIELMPEDQNYFNDNFDQISNQLLELDQNFTDVIHQVDRHTILVTHAAYGYWERDYGLEQIAITGLSANEEPSQRQLTHLIELIQDSEIDYLLFDQNIQPRVATVIQEEAGLASLEIHNLEVLTEQDIEADEDYFSLMERNINVLEEALQ
ncbi:metal ABC transporter solute-binding protein, Zn/Mn family [Amphibacillus sp. Q70]|uniref:metal ABC transporter solute-binding protein, Zn/Mn family n=1 Tax=Amphibacillus sp. Q70 TaxID=3453416 RepID=UPI003F85CA09